VVATRWRGRSAAVAGLPVAIVGAMVVVDIVIAGTLSSPLAAVVLTDLAVGFWVVLANREPGPAAAMAALSSIGVSVAVAGIVRVEGYSYPELVTGSWFGFGELVALAYVTAVAVRLVRPPAAAAIVVLFGAALVALVRLRHEGTLEDVLAIPMAVGFVGTVAVGLYLRSVDQAREQADLRIRQDERNEIARELHDLVAHHVTGIVLQAQAAQLVSDERPEVAAEALATIEGAGSEALRSMRAMVGTLRADRTAPLAPTATADDLRAMASAHPGEVPVHVAIDDDVALLPSSLVASLHRIAREAVTNARRHARGATRIDLVISRDGGEVRISVTDDGAPVAAAATGAGQGFGLVGIAERVDALGGRFRAGPVASGGWELVARLPVAPR
jgi:signal transduction histidine kinase